MPSNNAEMINIAAKKDHKNLQEKFSQYKNIFQGNFFIGALSFNEQYDQTTQFICEEATNADISVVALNDVCFISQDDHLAHQAKVAINNATLLKDEIDSPNISQEQYFKTFDEMQSIHHKSILENTLEVAKLCNVFLEEGQYYLPTYEVDSDKSLSDIWNLLLKKNSTSCLVQMSH